MNLCILPLEHGSPFIKGEYGLTPCTVRGIVRVSNKQRLSLNRGPLLINSLSIIFKGQRVARIWDSLTCSLSFRCEECFLEIREYLLREPETIPYGRVLELPFEILLPKPFFTDETPSSIKYLPPSITVAGMNSVGYGHQYECAVRYSVSAEMISEGGNSEVLFSTTTPTIGETIEVPFLLYNPSHLIALMWPETRRWRSLPGMTVLEYDIELGNVAMGPGDPLRLVYRMRLTKGAIERNVRIKKVQFMLKETHTIGECYTDCQDKPEHCKIRIKNTNTLINFPLKASDFKSSKLRLPPKRRLEDPHDIRNSPDLLYPSKCFRSIPEGFWDSGTSLFSENILYIPPRGKTTPSTAECYLSTVKHKHCLKPHIDISHTLQVTVEFSGADSITMRGSCVIYPVGGIDYTPLFETNPEILPTPDYEKVVGCERWVPDYTESDDASNCTTVKLSKDALTAINAVYDDINNASE